MRQARVRRAVQAEPSFADAPGDFSVQHWLRSTDGRVSAQLEPALKTPLAARVLTTDMQVGAQLP